MMKKESWAWRSPDHCKPILFKFFKFLIEVQLIYKAVLIFAAQQSDSAIHIYTFFFIFFSIWFITGHWI